jgi:putative transposase
MPRPPRHFVPGYPAHLVHRGNNRQDIFHCDGDFRFLWKCLKESSQDFEVAVHAYVMMSNHIHLLVTPRDASAVSKTMHCAARRYAGYYNNRYARTGTLWEGRFHAALIPTDRYLLACHRYIDLNPVRAGIVQGPELYPWSSHRAYRFGSVDPLVTPHTRVIAMGFEARARQAAYQALFEDIDNPAVDDIREASRACRPVGSSGPRRGRPSQHRP